MKRWLWIIGVAVVAGAGIFWGMRPQPVAVEATAVRTGPLRVTVEEEGKTRLRSRYVVMAPVAGYMGRIGLKAGDTVRAGAAECLADPRAGSVLTHPGDAELLARELARWLERVAGLAEGDVEHELREPARAAVATRGFAPWLDAFEVLLARVRAEKAAERVRA